MNIATIECDGCDGTGATEGALDAQYRRCADCEGRGRVCAACSGRGCGTTHFTDCGDVDWECPDCDGYGHDESAPDLFGEAVPEREEYENTPAIRRWKAAGEP